MQQKLKLQSYPLQYGGVLRTKAKNRGARPLSTKESMHIVLRSSQTKRDLSLRSPKHRKRISQFIANFSYKKGIRIFRAANVGNHLHLQVQVPNRTLYKQWIRGLTAGIAVIVAGHKKLRELKNAGLSFWDYRPFSRVIRGLQAALTLKHYIEVNHIEGFGHSKIDAKMIWADFKTENFRT